MGTALGWLLSLVSGDLFVMLMIGTFGLVVGGILGIVLSTVRLKLVAASGLEPLTYGL
jgi:hypothetical protein